MKDPDKQRWLRKVSVRRCYLSQDMQEVETASHVGTGVKNFPGEGTTVAKALGEAFPAVVREVGNWVLFTLSDQERNCKVLNQGMT